MTPNFEDLSCEFAFGQDALPAEEDPLMQEVRLHAQEMRGLNYKEYCLFNTKGEKTRTRTRQSKECASEEE